MDEIKTSLIDSNNWTEDKEARAISYFLTERKMPMAINRELIGELKKVSEQRGKHNARLCLHSNPEAVLHDMLILEYQDKTCRKPHKHPQKVEIMHMLEGEMMSFVFDDHGKLVERTLLGSENFIYIMPKGVDHFYMPVTASVLYREVKPGPFVRKEDIIYWGEGHIKSLKEYADFAKDIRCHNPGCKNQCPLGMRKR